MKTKNYPPKDRNHLHNLASWQSRTWQDRHMRFEEKLKLAKERHKERKLIDDATSPTQQ